MIMYGLMDKETFEKEVRELRYRQRRFFRCRKDDADRPKALDLMREQEAKVREEVEFVMMIRPKGKKAESKREQFFLDVADMMAKQKEWMKQGGGHWYMNPARDLEKKVDDQLREWDEEKKAERQRKAEEEAKRQTSLFQ